MTFLILTSMRNEGPHLLEWVAHHRALGAGILAMSNDCEDGTDRMLDRLEALGIVRHAPTPEGPKPPQWRALKRAEAHPAAEQAEWIAHIDCDEFINLRAPLNTLEDLVAALPPEADALAMQWRLFGNAGRMAAGEGATTARFTQAIAQGAPLPLSQFFKTLYRREAFQKPGVHRPKQKKGRVPVWVDGSGRALPEQLAAEEGRINLFGMGAGSDLVQLNHYSVRSGEEFIVKRQRGLPNRTGREIGLGYWVERNFNEVAEPSIARLADQTGAVLDELRGDAELGALETQAQDWHRAAFEAAMRDRKTVQLYWQMHLAGGSHSPDAAQVQAHLERLARCGN